MSIFSVIGPKARRSSPKRRGPGRRLNKIPHFHLPPITPTTASIGHV
jgi:hypothetical protein